MSSAKMRQRLGHALKPCTLVKPGRAVLDCSGAIHRRWLAEAAHRHLKVMVYRRDFRAEDLASLPPSAAVQAVSGELFDVLDRSREGISLLIDDVGTLHFHEQPLELLRRYYEALAWDGEAWLRFPRSFWVFLEDQHRVSLADYLVAKFPMLARKLGPAELDPALELGPEDALGDWVLLKKDRHFPKIFFHLVLRTLGGTSAPAGGRHAPFLEFVEKPKRAAPEEAPAAAAKRAA